MPIQEEGVLAKLGMKPRKFNVRQCELSAIRIAKKMEVLRKQVKGAKRISAWAWNLRFGG